LFHFYRKAHVIAPVREWKLLFNQMKIFFIKPIYLLGQILPAVMKNGISACPEGSLCYQDCFIIGPLSITSRFVALRGSTAATTGSRQAGEQNSSPEAAKWDDTLFIADGCVCFRRITSTYLLTAMFDFIQNFWTL
jgi:hypothetical protein